MSSTPQPTCQEITPSPQKKKLPHQLIHPRHETWVSDASKNICWFFNATETQGEMHVFELSETQKTWSSNRREL